VGRGASSSPRRRRVVSCTAAALAGDERAEVRLGEQWGPEGRDPGGGAARRGVVDVVVPNGGPHSHGSTGARVDGEVQALQNRRGGGLGGEHSGCTGRQQKRRQKRAARGCAWQQRDELWNGPAVVEMEMVMERELGEARRGRRGRRGPVRVLAAVKWLVSPREDGRWIWLWQGTVRACVRASERARQAIWVQQQQQSDASGAAPINQRLLLSGLRCIDAGQRGMGGRQRRLGGDGATIAA
jgi:hypothetical protein